MDPLLYERLEGPAFLRFSSHNLPDLVIALHGIVDIDLDARIDSIQGGIRTSFVDIPNAPASRLLFLMQGGQKGLIVNRRNLCAGHDRAKAGLAGQDGRSEHVRPIVKPGGCGSKHKRRH